MKRRMLSKLFLLVAAIMAVAFLLLFGQQAALPTNLEYINAGQRRWNPKLKSTNEPPEAIRPRNARNSTPKHQELTDYSKDSLASGNRTEGKVEIAGAYKVAGEGIVCDHSHSRTCICSTFGHVQMDAKLRLFLLNTVIENNYGIEEKLKPYPRKSDNSVMELVSEVTLKSKAVQDNSMLKCDVQHEVPAVVFSTGGYTGNLYHEFNDGIIPLYITSQHLQRDVVLVIVDYQDWWRTKYDEVLNQLTMHRIINFENETRIHCFRDVTTGLFIHGELTIDPALMPNNETILDFRALLERAYTPWYPLPKRKPLKRPKLVILVREGSRKLVNLNQIVRLARKTGFNVTLWQPLPTTDLKDTYQLLNSSHVLMGVHGAALTHFLFMPPGSVLVQIIPIGIDWASQNYYGDPAQRMGLQYIGYKIGVNESTLSDKYRESHTILTSPDEIISQGWSTTKKIYLDSQDVRLDLARFKHTLVDAKRRVTRLLRQDHSQKHYG